MSRILGGLLAALFLLPAVPASANTYEVYSCWAGYGTFRNPNASSVAWTRDLSAAGGHFAAGDDCGVNQTSGSLSLVSLGSSSVVQGQHADLMFAAPSGTTIAGASLWRRAWTYGSGTGAASQRNFLSTYADGAPQLVEADGGMDVLLGASDTTSHGITPGNLLSLNLNSLAPTRLSYRVGCGLAAGCPAVISSAPAPSHFASGIELFGAIVSVRDPTPPSLMLGTRGLFDGQDASGTKGVEVVAASDASGIKRISVLVDGSDVAIGELDYEADVNWCDWSQLLPCRNATEVEIPVDTTRLTDGQHSFVVKAFDAAGNERTSSIHYVTVRNAVAQPEPQPTPTPTPSPTAPPNPDGAGLPNGTTDNGSGSGAGTVNGAKLSVVFDDNSRSRIKARYGRMVVVRGTLSDTAGGRIGNAQVDYTALGTTPRARVQNLGAVRTDSNGTFVLTVATKLGSRMLRFAYRPQLGGAIATTADARLDVMAPVTLSISPRRVRNRHSITFAGRLTAGPIPRGGKLLDMQVVVDGRWHTFATVRTNGSGRYRFRYRFMRTYGTVTYRFRTLSRYEAAYPFYAGSSRTVSVRVRG